MALYHTYRPACFADVVGQEHVTEPLMHALDNGRINHAYLFSGPRGTGKTSSARILARSLNCEQGPTSQPCGECDSCRALAPGGPGSFDVTELDAASHGGVDDTRELRDRAFMAPASSRYRVFIIDEAHMVTTAGFNALLKIVEEPPEHIIFIFATTEPEKVLPTIRSRTHHYPFRLLSPVAMRGLLERICEKEGVTVDPAVYPLVVRAGGGSPRDALSVMDQLLAGAGSDGITYAHALALLGATDTALLDEAVSALSSYDAAAMFQLIEKVVQAGHDPRRFTSDLLDRFRDLLLLKSVPKAVEQGMVFAPDDQLQALQEQANNLGAATMTRYADVLSRGLSTMRGATSPRILLELMVARMVLPAQDDSHEALLQRLETAEHGLSVVRNELRRRSEQEATQRKFDVGAATIAAQQPIHPHVQPAPHAPAAAQPEQPQQPQQPQQPEQPEQPAEKPAATASTSAKPAAEQPADSDSFQVPRLLGDLFVKPDWDVASKSLIQQAKAELGKVANHPGMKLSFKSLVRAFHVVATNSDLTRIGLLHSSVDLNKRMLDPERGGLLANYWSEVTGREVQLCIPDRPNAELLGDHAASGTQQQAEPQQQSQQPKTDQQTQSTQASQPRETHSRRSEKVAQPAAADPEPEPEPEPEEPYDPWATAPQATGTSRPPTPASAPAEPASADELTPEEEEELFLREAKHQEANYDKGGRDERAVEIVNNILGGTVTAKEKGAS